MIFEFSADMADECCYYCGGPRSVCATPGEEDSGDKYFYYCSGWFIHQIPWLICCYCWVSLYF